MNILIVKNGLGKIGWNPFIVKFHPWPVIIERARQGDGHAKLIGKQIGQGFAKTLGFIITGPGTYAGYIAAIVFRGGDGQGIRITINFRTGKK